MSRITRRDFTKATAAGVATATALSAAACSARTTASASASSAWATAAIRCSTRFLEHKDCEVAAVCDIYQPYLDFAAKKIGGNPEAVQGLPQAARRARTSTPSSIATPDHWHALQTIHACQAEKDVYVEKPLSLCVAEGRAMVEGRPRAQARRAGRHPAAVERRSCQEAAELIRGGGIGKVTVVRCVPRPERVAQGHRQPAGRGPAEGLRLGRLARAGPDAEVQQEPHLLPLPLVLRLLRRAAHQLRRPLPRADPRGRSGVDAPKSVVGAWAASSPTTTTARCPTRWR